MSDNMEDLQETYPGAGTFQFGKTEAENIKLLKKVRNKVKTAASEAFREFKDDMGAMPKVGRCDIAANWDGSPALVIQTTSVRRGRFCDVTEEMALAEGEHKSLHAWVKDRRAYFDRTGGFDPQMEIVFEHFEVFEDLAKRPKNSSEEEQ